MSSSSSESDDDTPVPTPKKSYPQRKLSPKKQSIQEKKNVQPVPTKRTRSRNTSSSSSESDNDDASPSKKKSSPPRKLSPKKQGLQEKKNVEPVPPKRSRSQNTSSSSSESDVDNGPVLASKKTSASPPRKLLQKKEDVQAVAPKSTRSQNTSSSESEDDNDTVLASKKTSASPPRKLPQKKEDVQPVAPKSTRSQNTSSSESEDDNDTALATKKTSASPPRKLPPKKQDLQEKKNAEPVAPKMTRSQNAKQRQQKDKISKELTTSIAPSKPVKKQAKKAISQVELPVASTSKVSLPGEEKEKPMVPKKSGTKKLGKNIKCDEGQDITTVARIREEFDGMSIILGMSDDDVEEFLNRLDLQSPIEDNKPIVNREKTIDWEKISFSYYGPEQCKMAWTFLKDHARKFRVMHEIVGEMKYTFKTNPTRFKKKIVEAGPGFPKQPYVSGGFQVYCKDLWDKYKNSQDKINAKTVNFLNFQTKCYQDWLMIPEAEQEKYHERARIVQAEYKQKVKDYYARFPFLAPREEKLNKHGKPQVVSASKRKEALKLSNEIYKDAPKFPLNPLQSFINSKLNRLDPPPTADEIPDLKNHYLDKWKSLPKPKKLKWIESSIRKSEEYIKDIKEYKKTHPLFLLPKQFQISKLISKDEFIIWGEAHGQPPKPKFTAFDLFLEEFQATEEPVGTEEEIRKLAVSKWDQLPSYKKESYKLNVKLNQLNFRHEFETYYNQLPHMLKALAVETLPKKHKKNFLDEIDKVPLILDEDEPEPTQSTEQNSADASDKTSKKRKKDSHSDSGEDGDGNQGSQSDQNDGDEGDSHKKKKKKKRKKKSQSDDKEAVDIPLYMEDLTTEHMKLLSERRKEERYSSGRLKSAVRVPENRTPEDYAPGKTVTQWDVNQTIRGFFDGRPAARRFTAYYYYAKHVANEGREWLELYNKQGVAKTADRIIEKFQNLSLHQKEIFIVEAYNFHYAHRLYKSTTTSVEGIAEDWKYEDRVLFFPGEPVAPPKNAMQLYIDDMKKTARKDGWKDQIVPWDKLDEDTQMIYMKKLYCMTKRYIQEFEQFVKDMTPNDLVEYVIKRFHDYERLHKRIHKTYHQSEAIRTAVNAPHSKSTYSLEMSDDGQESEPDICESTFDPNIRAARSHTFKFKNNPFSVQKVKNSYAKNFLVEKLCNKKLANLEKLELQETSSDATKKKEPDATKDPDLPSSTDEEHAVDESDEHCSSKARKRHKEIRELERFNYYYDYYPLHNFYHASILDKIVFGKYPSFRLKDRKLRMGFFKSRSNFKMINALRIRNIIKDLEQRKPISGKCLAAKIISRSKRALTKPKQVGYTIKKRGRPPKNQLSENAPKSKQVRCTIKKRGRPPKKQLSKQAAKLNKVGNNGKKRGRPRKKQSSKNAPKPKSKQVGNNRKKRGRPSKKQPSENAPKSEDKIKKQVVSVPEDESTVELPSNPLWTPLQVNEQTTNVIEELEESQPSPLMPFP